MTTMVTHTEVQLSAIYEDDLWVWVAIGRYRRDGEVWQSFGFGVTALEAHLDLVGQLQEARLDFVLVCCANERERRALAWSAAQRTLMATGIPVREVRETSEVHG